MKKVNVMLAAVAMLGAVQAFAQTRPFEGLSLGANLDFDHGSLSASDGSSSTGNSTRMGLQARYDWALGEQFLLGVGATVGTGQRAAGSYATAQTAAYTKNRYALDLMPGYVLDPQLMVYGKVSALSASAASDDGSSNATVHGTAYGIGLRGLMDSHSYWQVGLDKQHLHDVSFSTGTTAAFTNDVLSVGVGYKF